jgi:hypothetical protein
MKEMEDLKNKLKNDIIYILPYNRETCSYKLYIDISNTKILGG